jgi:hypothetical protein
MESKLQNSNVTKKHSPHTNELPETKKVEVFCKSIIGTIYERNLETLQSSPSLLSVNLFSDQGDPSV